MKFICVKQVQGTVAKLFPVGSIIEPIFKEGIAYYDCVTLSQEVFMSHFVEWTGSVIVEGFELEANPEQTAQSLAIMGNHEEIAEAKLNIAKTGYEGFKSICKSICLRIIAEELARECKV